MNSRRVKADGIDWNYREAGEGPVLVLVHGFLSSSYTWVRVMPELARHFRVIVPDLPGTGDSFPLNNGFHYSLEKITEALAGFLRHLGIFQASWAGNSLGGAVCLLAADQEPDLVRRLVLSAPATPWTQLTPFLKALRIPLAGELLMALKTRAVVRKGLERMYGDPEAVTEEAVSGWYDPMSRFRAKRAALKLIRSVVPGSRGEIPRRIVQPSLVISGDRDILTPWQESERLARELPSGRFELFKGAGHLPQEEAPEKFLQAVVPFLLADAT